MKTDLAADQSLPVNTPKEVHRFILPRVGKVVLNLTLLPVIILTAGFAARAWMGQDFLDLLVRTDTSSVALAAFGAMHALWLFIALVFRLKRRESVWQPIRMVLTAAWLIPTLPGPIGESISPMAHVLLFALT